MINLDNIVLQKGAHEGRCDLSGVPTVCAMELVAWLCDEEHTDAPECVSPEIAAYVRSLNDAMPDDQRQRLKPFLPRTMNTADDGKAEERMYIFADHAVCVFAANALETTGLTNEAKTLRALAPIADKETASAAWSAAELAAESAARSAAESAAWSAESAAWSARSAAESAAWSAESAAESARSAAESAAWSAESAWDAALDLLDKILP